MTQYRLLRWLAVQVILATGKHVCGVYTHLSTGMTPVEGTVVYMGREGGQNNKYLLMHLPQFLSAFNHSAHQDNLSQMYALEE